MTICWHHLIVNFLDVVLFLLSRLVTGPSFMSISPLVLELWQFSFISDWPEIRKSERTPSVLCPISFSKKFGTTIHDIMLLNAEKACTISELLRKNQQGEEGGKTILPHPDFGWFWFYLHLSIWNLHSQHILF